MKYLDTKLVLEPIGFLFFKCKVVSVTGAAGMRTTDFGKEFSSLEFLKLLELFFN